MKEYQPIQSFKILEIQDLPPKSIFNPKIHIDNHTFALTYAKKTYASGTNYPEHGLLIVQSINILHRIEIVIKYNPIKNIWEAMVEKN